MTSCPACTAPLSAAAYSCPTCGHPLRPAAPAPVEGRSRLAATLLALFFGGFGIHKFYLGRKGQGILYLVFFWTIIPAIVAFFEAIRYLLMSDADFNRRYNAGPSAA